MREGVANKGGGYRAARRGHKQGRGVIALKKETDKHINKHLNAQEGGHREGWEFERNESSNKALKVLNVHFTAYQWNKQH